MNHERHEDLAALAALDLLSANEQAELNAAVAVDPSLQGLIDSLRSAAAELARIAPAVEPPAALKARILAHIAVLPATARETPQLQTQILEFKKPKPKTPNSKLPAWVGWAAAACLALTSAWLGQSLLTAQKADASLHDQQTLADLELHSAQNQLEAERLIARRELADATARATAATSNLSALQARLDTATAASTDLATRLNLTRTEIETTRLQLAQLRAGLASREAQIAALDRQLKEQGDLATYKIASLVSIAGNTPEALAVAVWNPANQQGVLSVQKLPALTANSYYELWLIDPQYASPVSGGVFTVDPATGASQVHFHPAKPVKTAAKFAITLERKDGSAQPSTLLFVSE